jgi:menaquinone-specific isochorismate synthase
VNRIFWRSKEGREAPKSARFFLQPFAGSLMPLDGEIVSALPSPIEWIEPLARIDEPNREEWCKRVKKTLDQIARGTLQKVVLARRTTFHLEQPVDPFRILAALKKKAQGAALFCLERGKKAFLGASPERLFRREGRTLFVDALAGTRKKGELFSEKDAREFQFVENYFRDSTLCEKITFSPLSIHQTANLQHYYSQGTGLLKPHISDVDIVQTLHPTPALCGTPKKQAFEWIETLEPFHRDLYGGVLGWSNQEEADSTVCIRCAAVEGTQIHCYTGAGIVAGSDPDAEWEELESKLSLYQEIIQCGPSLIS